MKPWPVLLAVLVGVGAIAVGAHIWRHSNVGQVSDCVETRNCLPSYHNTAICESLPVGTPERELVFRLGQPVESRGASVFFEPGATERGPIEIEP